MTKCLLKNEGYTYTFLWELNFVKFALVLIDFARVSSLDNHWKLSI